MVRIFCIVFVGAFLAALAAAASSNPSDITVDLEATRPYVPIGTNAMFMVAITNSGKGELNNIAVEVEDQSLVTTCAKTSSTNLQPSDRYSFVCSVVGVQKDTTLSLRACANLVATNRQTCSQYARATVTVTSEPKLRIVKSIVGTPACDGTTTFSIQVQNCGVSGIKTIKVRDPQAPDCDRDFTTSCASGTIIPTYTCTGRFEDGDTSTATVVGNCERTNRELTDSSTVTIKLGEPGVHITKTANSPICAGAAAMFSITVSNPSCCALSSVVVTDAKASDCNKKFDRIGPGESKQYTCSLANVAQTFTNRISVTAKADGKKVSDSATTEVVVTPSPLTITKTPSASMVNQGDKVKFSIEIVNQQDTACTSVIVTDPQSPKCAMSFPKIEPGAENAIRYTCKHDQPIKSTLTNTITVTADCGCEPSCAASATAVVKVHGSKDDEECDGDTASYLSTSSCSSGSSRSSCCSDNDDFWTDNDQQSCSSTQRSKSSSSSPSRRKDSSSGSGDTDRDHNKDHGKKDKKDNSQHRRPYSALAVDAHAMMMNAEVALGGAGGAGAGAGAGDQQKDKAGRKPGHTPPVAHGPVVKTPPLTGPRHDKDHGKDNKEDKDKRPNKGSPPAHRDEKGNKRDEKHGEKDKKNKDKEPRKPSAPHQKKEDKNEKHDKHAKDNNKKDRQKPSPPKKDNKEGQHGNPNKDNKEERGGHHKDEENKGKKDNNHPGKGKETGGKGKETGGKGKETGGKGKETGGKGKETGGKGKETGGKGKETGGQGKETGKGQGKDGPQHEGKDKDNGKQHVRPHSIDPAEDLLPMHDPYAHPHTHSSYADPARDPEHHPSASLLF